MNRPERVVVDAQADGRVRLQKWLAEAGLCSRREGERWIANGRVAVNGQVITQMGVQVGPQDLISVDDRPVVRHRQEKLVTAMHKPPGVLCTRHDPEGRPTLFDLVDRTHRWITVGRLDYLSEGLILLTTDGELAHRLMHPSHQVERVYRVRVRGEITPELAERLQEGVDLEDGPTGPLTVVLDRRTTSHVWLTLTLREGRNRMVRRIFESLGMTVARLIRIGYGGVTLGDLPSGGVRPLAATEMKLLRGMAGLGVVRPGR